MSKTIGIDLGTCNSSAAVALGRDQVVMVESKYGSTLYGKNFPSFVLFDFDGNAQAIGQRAKEDMPNNPGLVVWGAKRLVGISYDTAQERGELDRFQYEIERGPGNSILIKVGQERFSPSHVLELILREIKDSAENSAVNPMLGGTIDAAVISVPAFFKAARTQAIVDAATQAGFKEIDTIAEPTAAALRYGMTIDRETILVAFDIGGGTLDVTLMQVICEEGELIPGELCTSGHESLGGIDMDDLMRAHLVEKHGLPKDPRSMAILKDEVEKAKIRLSTRDRVLADLPNGNCVELLRGEMEEILEPLLRKCRNPIRMAMQQAQLGAELIDHVILVGGPTQMPCVRRTVRDELARLGARPEVLAEIDAVEEHGFPVSPMECVCQGAALKAGNIVVPVTSSIPEGYGTILGSNCYASIVEPNSPYPIQGSLTIAHQNVTTKHVPVALVAKTPDPDNSTASQTVYKYEDLGNYFLSIDPTGEPPSVEIRLEITGDKRLLTTLIHEQSRQHVRYQSLDLMKGKEAPLREDNRPPALTPVKVDELKADTRHAPAGWTAEELERCVHVARQTIEMAAGCQDPRVTEGLGRLQSAVDDAVRGNFGNPREDGPTITNRIRELLSVLVLPGVEVIGENEYRDYMRQLQNIAG